MRARQHSKGWRGGFVLALTPPISSHGHFLRSPREDELQCGDGHNPPRSYRPWVSRDDSLARRSDKVRSAASSACPSYAALRTNASESRLIVESWHSLDLAPQQARQPHASQLLPILPPARLRSPARITRFRQPPARRRFCFRDSETPLAGLLVGGAEKSASSDGVATRARRD